MNCNAATPEPALTRRKLPPVHLLTLVTCIFFGWRHRSPDQWFVANRWLRGRPTLHGSPSPRIPTGVEEERREQSLRPRAHGSPRQLLCRAHLGDVGGQVLEHRVHVVAHLGPHQPQLRIRIGGPRSTHRRRRSSRRLLHPHPPKERQRRAACQSFVKQARTAWLLPGAGPGRTARRRGVLARTSLS